jgi:hypothetical protein
LIPQSIFLENEFIMEYRPLWLTGSKRFHNAFLSDMRAACIATYGSTLNWFSIVMPFPNPLRRCLAAAQGYYVAVASPFARYRDAQLEYCEICP